MAGVGEASRKILACCTSAPFSTAASRRSVCIHPPALLRQVRADRRAPPVGSVALRANRRLERTLVPQHATRQFQVAGGLRQQRYRDGWRTISFLTFSAGGAPTCDRDVWRAELQAHWRDRFSDDMDAPAAQERFRLDCASLLDRCGGPLRVSFGDVVSGLTGAKPGAGGGADSLVAEMLHILPWSAVWVLWRMMNERFAAVGAKVADDPLRIFLTTWIRKDT